MATLFIAFDIICFCAFCSWLKEQLFGSSSKSQPPANPPCVRQPPLTYPRPKLIHVKRGKPPTPKRSAQ